MAPTPDAVGAAKEGGERWQQFRLPARYVDGQAAGEGGQAGATPLVAFINPGSGGQLGERVADFMQAGLGAHQVFRVGKKCSPEEVLQRLWAGFERAAEGGDEAALETRARVRLLACGGDGTIAWVLNCVGKLGLEPCPPVAVVPLGTGNGLSINFGWGKRTEPGWDRTLLQTLEGVPGAAVRCIDLWSIEAALPAAQLAQAGQLPAALSVSQQPAQQQQSPSRKAGGGAAAGGGAGAANGHAGAGPPAAGRARMQGEFAYYYTLGLDAEAAYRFDSLRRRKPWLTSFRKGNIFWYMWYVIRTGWFCGASPLRQKVAQLQVRNAEGQWQDVELSKETHALLILNLQTYSGSRDVWGLRDTRPEQGSMLGFGPPIFDDGLLEVVALEGGLQSWAALSGLRRYIHGTRLAQASELRLRLRSDKPGKGSAMRLDGEPWWQRLPSAPGQEVEVTIRRSGRARMLLNTARLPGMTPRLLEIAKRELALSSPVAS